MRILGIDPGLGMVGFGLVEVTASKQLVACEWGVIKTSKELSDAARLREVHCDLTKLLQQLQPDVVSIEKLFFFRNAKTMVPVCQARGVILLALEEQRLSFSEYTPMQVKQSVTGYGKSDKKEIQSMVAHLLNMKDLPKPDDAADALALGITHYHHTGRISRVAT